MGKIGAENLFGNRYLLFFEYLPNYVKSFLNKGSKRKKTVIFHCGTSIAFIKTPGLMLFELFTFRYIRIFIIKGFL